MSYQSYFLFGLSLVISGAAFAQQPADYLPPRFPAAYYKLTNKALHPQNGFLEGNKHGPGSPLGGATRMTTHSNDGGQAWLFSRVPDSPEALYRILTLKGERQELCLEGNHVVPGAALDGAAVLVQAGNASGQLWKMVPAKNGYFRLTNQYLESKDMFLTGGSLNPSSARDAAHMERRSNSAGQLWKLIPMTQ